MNKAHYKSIAKNTKPHIYNDAVMNGKALGENKNGWQVFEGKAYMIHALLSPRGVYQVAVFALEKEDDSGKWWVTV